MKELIVETSPLAATAKACGLFSRGKIKVRENGYGEHGNSSTYTYNLKKKQTKKKFAISSVFISFHKKPKVPYPIIGRKGMVEDTWEITKDGVLATMTVPKYPVWLNEIKHYDDMFETPIPAERWKHIEPIRPARYAGEHLFITGNSKVWEKSGGKWVNVEKPTLLSELSLKEYKKHFTYKHGCILNK